MKDKKNILGSIFGLVLITLFISLFFVNKIIVQKTEYKQAVSSDEPTDIVMDFYEEWVDAVQSTSTTPYQLELTKAPILSKTLSDRLVATPENQEIDPVLCQKIPPTKISSRTVFTEADKSQILVFSKEPKQAGQAVFALSRLDEGWYIDDILCSQGESGVPYEFSFEHEGGIFKNEEPVEGENYWNLLYTQDTKIYIARLFFTTNSMCIDTAGNESICNPDQFVESKVTVQGEMSETGVEVKQLKVITKSK